MNNVISNIKFTLPSPTLAQDKSAFEELKDYVEIIDLVLNNMFPDEMVSDPDMSAIVKVVRSSVKRTILQTHIKSNSLLSELNFEAFKNVDVVGPIDITQKVMNIKRGIDDMIKNFKPAEGDTTGSDSSSTPTSW
jgi:hypothetical protein